METKLEADHKYPADLKAEAKDAGEKAERRTPACGPRRTQLELLEAFPGILARRDALQDRLPDIPTRLEPHVPRPPLDAASPASCHAGRSHWDFTDHELMPFLRRITGTRHTRNLADASS